MFEASAGLLLQKTYHKSYDALKWSLYERVSAATFVTLKIGTLIRGKDGVFYVHYFNPDNEVQRALNGKRIPLDRFRYLDPPDSRLLAWHYAQAVRMRIRGYSVGMQRRGRN